MHWGQRKLMLTEIDFFNRIEKKIGINKKIALVYPGSAIGTHLLFMMELYPNIHLYLWDPRIFHRSLMATDRRRRGFDANRAYNIGRVFINPDMTNDEYEDWLSIPDAEKGENSKGYGFFTKKSSDYFNEHYADKYSHVCFVTDIRLFDFSEKTELIRMMNTSIVKDKRYKKIWRSTKNKMNSYYERDMSLQRGWFYDVKADFGLFKFKPPKSGDTDFLYPEGDVIVQPWGPATTTESRLFVLKNAKHVKYNPKIYEDRFRYVNSISRMLSINSFRDTKIGEFSLYEIWTGLIPDSHIQLDAFIEADIVHDYLQNRNIVTLDNIRNFIGVLTNRLMKIYIPFTPGISYNNLQTKRHFINRLDYHSIFKDDNVC